MLDSRTVDLLGEIDWSVFLPRYESVTEIEASSFVARQLGQFPDWLRGLRWFRIVAPDLRWITPAVRELEREYVLEPYQTFGSHNGLVLTEYVAIKREQMAQPRLL